VSLYVDSSCFLKLLFAEPESDRLVELMSSEPRMFVSTLTRIETFVQINAREVGRMITRREGDRLRRKLEELLGNPPFESATLSGSVLSTAERNARTPRRSGHCKTLDRLHLAAMESLGLRRLLTNDDQQAGAARALGFDVLMPR
jgi:predicted nucleic acid-binding protein